MLLHKMKRMVNMSSPEIDSGVPSLTPHKMLPLPSPIFTGRQEFLKRLQQHFARRNEPQPRRSFLLYGLGGMGKTQICLKFLDQNADL